MQPHHTHLIQNTGRSSSELILKNGLLYLLFFFLIRFPIFSDGFRVQEGDLIFQELKNSDSRAMKLITGNKYTHVGVILKYKGKFIVLESNGNVRRTELGQFLKKGVNAQYIIKRFKNYKDFFSEEKYSKLRDASNQFIGKHSDLYYGWGDEKLYSAELVWKFFKEALDIELCQLKKFKDYDYSHPYVRLILSQKYGKDLPQDEPTVTARDLMLSEFLETVYPKNLEDDETYPADSNENPFLEKEPQKEKLPQETKE